MITLTYGFCSPELEKHIYIGIAPKLDQHASHEKRRNGRLICGRQGAAADFLVEDEDMSEVVSWIADNTKYDRIYYYGNKVPIHVSWSQNPSNAVYDMTQIVSGRPIPRKVSLPVI